MAIGTLPDEDEKTVDRTRESDELFNNVYGDGAAKDINQAEQSGNGPINNKDTVQDREEAPDKPSEGFKNNFTGKQKVTGKVNLLKKKGPLGVIVTLLLGGGIGFSALFSPGLLIVQMKEMMLNKFNVQLASMDVRTTKMLTSKMGTTDGMCGSTITIRCKYSSMSDKQISKFEKAGIKVNSTKTTVLGRSKPTSFDFNGKNIKANEFNSKLASDPSFRSSLKQAYNPKFAGYADHIWKKAANKMGVSKKPATIAGKDDDERLKNVQDTTENPSTRDRASIPEVGKAKPSGGEYTAADVEAARAAADAANSISEGAGNVASTRTKVGGAILGTMETLGPAFKVTGIADTACTVYGTIQAVGYAAKTVRAVQLARYAMIFLNVADQIKAGTAKPDDVSYLGKILTTEVAAVGQIAATKSATDSFGYKFAAYGDRGKMNASASQFLAGGGLTGSLINVTATINSFLKGTPKKTCGVLRNPFVGGASLIAGIALMFVPGANVVMVLKAGAQAAALIALGAAISALPAMLQDIIAGVLIDKNTVGEAAGDAMTSGSSGLMGNVASAGGNAPLTPSQAVAYSSLSSNIAAQYAEEDRLAYSPFDITNSNTFIGKIVAQMTPYTSKMTSLSGTLSSTVSIATRSLASITTPTTKAVGTIADYEMCQDFDYSDLKGNDTGVRVATDPFCNISYGIPPEALNADPIAVAENLGDQIDPATGEPIPGKEYANFIKECIDRDRPLGDSGEDMKSNGSECLFDAKTNGDYYIHYIDQRVDTGMDGYDEGAGATTTTTDTVPVSGDTKALAKQIIDSPNVQFQTPPEKPLFQNIVDTGKQTLISSPSPIGGTIIGCDGTTQVPISSNLMSLVLTASQKYKLTLGVVASGHDCNKGFHPQGQAIDLNGVSRLDQPFIRMYTWDSSQTAMAKEFYEFLDAAAGKLGIKIQLGQKQCFGNSPPQLSNTMFVVDACNHIHLGVTTP